MSLSVGIVGLPNAGKSTLFNAFLGRRAADVAEHPFTTIKPNIGVVDVPDKRLEKLAELVEPQKVIPATIKFVDIAGLVKGSHQGEGLGNQFLGHIRTCDAILHLVRAFTNPSVSRAQGSVDPQGDVEIVNLELILADLETVEKKLSDLKSKFRLDKKLRVQKGILEKIKKVLSTGDFASKAKLSEGEQKQVKDLNLLTLKPMIYVLNTDEQGSEEKLTLKVPFLTICAALESDLADLEPEEKKEYQKELGLKKSGLDKLVKLAYQLLDLVTFYTIKGGKEVHGWSIKNGANAIKAAGKVHTDMARGFIKAEVIPVKELVEAGGWPEAKKLGKIELKGREYQINDGEVIEFKFSV